MKVNLKKVSGVVVAVGMISALSLTAFGGNVIDATPLIEAQFIATEEVKVDSEKTKAINAIKTETAIEVQKGEVKSMLQDYDIEEQADGSYKMTDKKTGETFTVSFASEVQMQKNDGSLKQAITVTQAVPKK